jgi:hypothetical protein
MIKQAAIGTCMGAMALTSSFTFAAREEHTFEVSLDIPSLAFYIIPSEAGWIHREQVLPWNSDASSLGGIRKHFDVKHDSSAIQARLESKPYLSNGRDNVYLRVSFNNTELSHETVPRQVVSAEQAMAGGRFLLEIQPKVPDGGYKPGTYHGNVQLIFNAAAP